MNGVSQLMLTVRRALPWALLFVGVFYVTKISRPAGRFQVGEHLPQFSAQLTDGSRFTLPEKPGTPMIVNFWATYCGPCREEAPLLSAAHQRGVQVIGLCTESDAPREALQKAAAGFGMTYPIAIGDNALLQRFRIDTVPTTYVLAPDGAIVLSRVGKIGASELQDALALANKH